MRVQATRAFTDRETGDYRARGDVFEVADARGGHLVSLGMAKQVDEPRRKARRAPRKQTKE